MAEQRKWAYGSGWVSLIALVLGASSLGRWLAGFGWSPAHMHHESALTVLAFGTTFVLLKRHPARPLAAFSPVLVIWAIHDTYFHVFGDVPSWRDFSKMSELAAITPLWQALLFVAFMASWVALMFRQVERPPKASRWLIAIVPWALVLAAWQSAPLQTLEVFASGFHQKGWSHTRNARKHGRLAVASLRELEYRNAEIKLAKAPRTNLTSLHLSAEQLESLQHRDVYLIVLESFIDARLFRNVKFNRPPLADALLELLNGQSPSVSFSPFFAGGTAEGEFEMLCGTPSFKSFGVPEFKMLTGHPIPCLPETLVRAGFQTAAFHPYEAHMYNRRDAYRSLGFQASTFLGRRPGDGGITAAHAEDAYVTDTALYAHVRRWRETREGHAPVFAHLLTMEGHTPFALNPKTQPPVIRSTPPDPVIETLANQSYYRSEALARFIKETTQARPNSLIIAVSDHLPPIIGEGRAFYQKWGYAGREAQGERGLREQFYLLVDGGKVQPLQSTRHFNIYRQILANLSQGSYCESAPCWDTDREAAWRRDDYQHLMATAVHGSPEEVAAPQ